MKPSQGQKVPLKMHRRQGKTWLEVDYDWLINQRVQDLLGMEADAIIIKFKYHGRDHYITNDEAAAKGIEAKNSKAIVIWLHEVMALLSMNAMKDKSVWFDNVKMAMLVKETMPGSTIVECNTVQ